MIKHTALADFDENDDIIKHPIYDDLKSGGVLESVSLDDEWSDDHCPCYNVTATVAHVDGHLTTHRFSDWWLSSVGTRMYYHSECDGDKADAARSQLKNHIIECIENF